MLPVSGVYCNHIYTDYRFKFYLVDSASNIDSFRISRDTKRSILCRPIHTITRHFAQQHLERKMSFSKPGFTWYFVAATSYVAVIHSVQFISGQPSQWIDPAENKMILSLFASAAHIAFSILTVGIGPFQFLATVRTKWPLVHVWLGRAYNLG